MRILLIAYEFPPSPSPQSLRWAYLVRELSDLGHELHVLAPDVPSFGGGLPALPSSVTVHRTFAGPVMGFLAWRNRRKRARAYAESISRSGPEQGGQTLRTVAEVEALNWKGRLWHKGLNWKGRMFEFVKSCLASLMFPDLRAEWNPWARKALDRVIERVDPDLVVASHEPASALSIGLLAKRSGKPFVADMGDPVLAPYTPRRWLGRALRLEAEVCREASHITVTCEHAKRVLCERHELSADKCSVISQGFDSMLKPAGDTTIGRVDRPLVLLYTGSFYRFRRATALIEAVSRVDGLVLEIASVNAPEEVARAAANQPDRIRILGFLHHSAVLGLQREVDILVNISNVDPMQVPGKLYEYLGAGRPILHLGGDEGDAGKQLIEGLRRGWVCPTDVDVLAERLGQLVAAHRGGCLHEGLDLSATTVHPYSWQAQANRLDQLLSRCVNYEANVRTAHC